MLANKIEAIGRAPLAALDILARAVWGDHAVGKLTDAEAQQLAEAIEARRKALKRPAQGHSPLKVAWSARQPNGRLWPTSSRDGRHARDRGS